MTARWEVRPVGGISTRLAIVFAILAFALELGSGAVVWILLVIGLANAAIAVLRLSGL
jgi:hypothetical protein